MQPYALTLDKFLDHAAKWWGDREIVTAGESRIGYAQLRSRSNRLSGAFRALGLRFGDRIGTLAWNTQHHVEVYYGAMGAGFVCHTLNPRLAVSHLAQMVNEAEDRVLMVGIGLADVARELVHRCPSVQTVVLMDEAAYESVGDRRTFLFETLLAELGAETEWGAFDEETPAGLCYTSGTTGSPKGVLYTHRSNYLHTLRALQADAVALTPTDSVLVAVPLFHANGWSLAFSAPMAGASIIMPGMKLDGASLYELLDTYKVSCTAAVPTVWMGLLAHLEATGGRLKDGSKDAADVAPTWYPTIAATSWAHISTYSNSLAKIAGVFWPRMFVATRVPSVTRLIVTAAGTTVALCADSNAVAAARA